MARLLRTLAVSVFAVWLGWNLYRHVLVYLLRGRVVVVTDRVLGNLILGAGGLAVLLSPFPIDLFLLIAVLGGDALLWWTQVWVLVGIPAGRIVERAGLVLSGMGFSPGEVGEKGLREAGGRISLRVAASPTARSHLLRVRTARGINKVALFRANLRKFLVAIPRERR
ncbi:MAG: hypothetical protein ACRDIX_02620 [Actinomycetota bacterium]